MKDEQRAVTEEHEVSPDQSTHDVETVHDEEQPAGRTVSVDLLGGLALLAIAGVFLLASGEGRMDWLMPVALSYTLVLIGIYLVVRGLLGRGERTFLVPGVLRGRGIDVAVFVAMSVVYVVLAPTVGFWVMSALMIIGSSLYLAPQRNRRVIVTSVLASVGVCVVFYLLMLHVFYVPLPASGWLPF